MARCLTDRMGSVNLLCFAFFLFTIVPFKLGEVRKDDSGVQCRLSAFIEELLGPLSAGAVFASQGLSISTAFLWVLSANVTIIYPRSRDASGIPGSVSI